MGQRAGKALSALRTPEHPPAETKLVPLTGEGGKKRYTVAVDFDGVLHRYDTPWIASNVIPDGPVEGAVQWYNEIAEDFDIAIHTTRARTPQGRVAVLQWLDEHGFFMPNQVTHEKIPALVYIDDRGWRFTGDNFPTREQIHAARPWNKEER